MQLNNKIPQETINKWIHKISTTLDLYTTKKHNPETFQKFKTQYTYKTKQY